MIAFRSIGRRGRRIGAGITIVALASLVTACSGGNTPGTFWYPQQNGQIGPLQTSTRKSYVGMEPGFEVSSTNRIRSLMRWTNKRGSLGCYVSWPPGCSIDTWRPAVDFNSIYMKFNEAHGWVYRSYSCSPNVGTVNSYNDYTWTCAGPWWSDHGYDYHVNGETTVDVKDDGRGNFVAGTNGTAVRRFN